MTHSPAVTLRLARDAERMRLAELDRLEPREGNSRLLEWTLATFPEDENEMAARKAKTPAADLIAALAFVSVAGTKDDQPYKMHVVLNNRFAIACDGQITAGHPITEELECCPQLKQLTAALAKCGTSLSIAELPNTQLSITGDRLTAKIPCLPFDALPDAKLTKPDPICAVIDDRLKAAFAVCGVIVSENGTRAVECGLLLEANACTGTDGKVLLQYWHGIDLPPGLFVPKIFAAAVCKIKLPLTGLGFTAGRSLTFYFENGAWIKTQLYEDKYPAVDGLINQASSPVAVPDGLFDAIETVAGFDANNKAQLSDGKVITANAEFEVEGLGASCAYDGEYTKMIAPFVKTIDLTTYDDRAFFFGDNVRGIIMGCKTNRPALQENEPSGSTKHVETMAEWTVRGGPASEIPF